MKEISTRKTGEGDFEFTYKVKKAALYVDIVGTFGPWNEVWQLREHQKDFSSGLLEVVTADGVDAGYIYIRRTEKVVYLVDICILPQHQGNGIGTHRIKNLLSEAKAHNIPVELGVSKINHSALKLYKSLGFNQIGVTLTHILMHS